MTGRSDWLEWRRGGLGGSDIGAIFGVSPFRGPWDVCLSKRADTEDNRGNRSTDTGHRLERVVAEYAAERLNAELEMAPAFGSPSAGNFYRVGPEYWMRASADGALTIPSDLGVYTVGLECKTAQWPSELWGVDGTDKIPPIYDLQCRWYMAAFNAPDWILSVFFKRADEWRIYRLARDLDREAEIVTFAGAWWDRHIVQGIEPEIDASRAAAKALGYLYAAPADDALEVATEAEEARIREYHDTKQAAADLTSRAALLGNQIRQDIGARQGLRFTGGRVKWSRPSNRLTVRIND
jgi:putative phage-type endonuclease